MAAATLSEGFQRKLRVTPVRNYSLFLYQLKRLREKKDDYFKKPEHFFFYFHLELNETCPETGYRERKFKFFPPSFSFCPRLTGGVAFACCATNISTILNASTQETEGFLILTTQYAAQGSGMATAAAPVCSMTQSPS